MTQHMPPQAMTLFDLIARRWELEAPITEVLFNAAGTSLMAVLEDGRLAFVPVKDAESPDARMRVEADTGRASIRPRSKPLPPPLVSEVPIARIAVRPCQLGQQGFAFVHAETGALWRATARGQTLAVAGDRIEGVTALAALPEAGRVVVARGSNLTLLGEDGGAGLAEVTLSHDVERIAVSGNGRLLGCWGRGQVSVVDARSFEAREPVACEGEVLDLAWSPCNRWLAAGCADKAMLLVDVAAGACDRIVDFPQPVSTLGFSESAGAMVGSGAFRVVGWSLPDLPFGDHEGTPVETGKPGLTIVERLAVHPARDLCAVSYANGLVIICRIGHPDEMLLREGGGAGVNALGWTADGAHLAIAGADGNLSVATFPKNMFK